MISPDSCRGFADHHGHFLGAKCIWEKREVLVVCVCRRCFFDFQLGEGQQSIAAKGKGIKGWLGSPGALPSPKPSNSSNISTGASACWGLREANTLRHERPTLGCLWFSGKKGSLALWKGWGRGVWRGLGGREWEAETAEVQPKGVLFADVSCRQSLSTSYCAAYGQGRRGLLNFTGKGRGRNLYPQGEHPTTLLELPK